jgi:hypothetical protein
MNNEFIRASKGNIPTLNGNANNYTMWWAKFKAFATLNGFSEAIQIEPNPDMPKKYTNNIDISTKDGKWQYGAKRMNDMAISSLNMAFDKEGIMRLISKAKTKEWPEGLAYLVVLELNKKFKPNDIITKVEMRQKLNQVSMKKGSDPALIFKSLAEIEDRYNGIGMINEMDLIAIVLDIATEEFQSILTVEQSSKGSNLSLQDLETIMNQHYRQIN